MTNDIGFDLEPDFLGSSRPTCNQCSQREDDAHDGCESARGAPRLEGPVLRPLPHHPHRRPGRRAPVPRLLDPRSRRALVVRRDRVPAAARRAAHRGRARGLRRCAEGGPRGSRRNSRHHPRGEGLASDGCAAHRGVRARRVRPGDGATIRSRRPAARASGSPPRCR